MFGRVVRVVRTWLRGRRGRGRGRRRAAVVLGAGVGARRAAVRRALCGTGLLALPGADRPTARPRDRPVDGPQDPRGYTNLGIYFDNMGCAVRFQTDRLSLNT